MKLYNKYIWGLLFMGASVGFTGCNDFLDVMPDQRTEVTPDNADYLLVSAYPNCMPLEIFEMYSDNTDAYPNRFSEMDMLQGDLFWWKDTSQNGTDSPAFLWESCYHAIAAANQVLDMVERNGNPANLASLKGEALLCRAFNHFVLATTFCKAYSQSAETDLGIPYMTYLETTVSPSYERGTLKETYEMIEKDLLEGIPLLDDSRYKQAKYHFTRNAAYALAARFYLNYTQPDLSNYDKVIDYATRVLGDNPSVNLRNWEAIGKLSVNGDVQPNEYIDVESPANILLISYHSYWGYVSGPYGLGERYAHGPKLSYETNRSNGPWGNYDPSHNVYYTDVWSNSSALPTKVVSMKVAQYKQVIDPVAGTINGYCVNAALTMDELLLSRAEAYAVKQDYESAVADLNAWMFAYTNQETPMTVESINNFYGRLAYYQPLQPTVKKELHPQFAIVSDVQENILHAVLQARRITTLYEGLRWLDIKRFGITIYRRFMRDDGKIDIMDMMKADDERRAIQLPSDVITAGMKPNPRN
jgi:tetratricopeptide (TPR) repeat protein